MLTHLRFHRRGHNSSPSSPNPDQLSPFDHGEHPPNVQELSPCSDFLPRPSNPSNTPPVRASSSRPDGEAVPIRKASEQSLRDANLLNIGESNFMGGIALRRVFDGNRQDASGLNAPNLTGKASARAKPVPPPIHTDLYSRPSHLIPIHNVQSTSPFVAPTDTQKRAATTGKRPAGTRLTSEPPTLAAAAQTVVETQRAKKGLPFLKSSMSGLLLRRKASQNAPDLHPLPLPQQTKEAAYEPIRGTVFHDFSAPRTRRIPNRQPTVVVPEAGLELKPQGEQKSLTLPKHPLTGANVAINPLPKASSESEAQLDTGLSQTPSNKTLRQEARRSSLEDQTAPAESSATAFTPADDGAPSSGSIKSRPISASPSTQRISPSTRTNKSRHTSVVDDVKRLSAVPKHMNSTSSRWSFDMKGQSDAALVEKLLEEKHRQKQLEKEASGGSAHRDSRFDDFDDDAFDYDAAMMDEGLEEEIPEVNDDYDENDYLEEGAPFMEEIPMIEEDIIAEQDEEEQEDPDNDQENFAGFVFTRSNPPSDLASPATPAILNTPLDAVGRPIGYAFTKEGTPALGSPSSPLAIEEDTLEDQDTDPSSAGLGIRGLEAPLKTQYDPTVFQERRNLPPLRDLESDQDKGLYYDSGLLDELQLESSEIQESAFDENLFDMEDVDQFGRPLPGIFKQNLDLSRKAQGHKQRDSDVTYPGSDVSGSTAHSSVSTSTQPNASIDSSLQVNAMQASSTGEDSDAALRPKATVASSSPQPTHESYQMALLEGVQKAAASGWTSRWADKDGDDVHAQSELDGAVDGREQGDSRDQGEHEQGSLETSPAREIDLTIISPTTASQPSTAGLPGIEAAQVDDYVEDNYLDDGAFDDDDYFDDDFIAEANAEALAYDDEGFYGTEFGFYSTPPPARSNSSAAAASGPPANNSFLGGYFGPSNIVSRTLSGRVLREPNLTPITEMSESPAPWSNRNSMMFGGLPSAGLSDLRNSNLSPGLAHVGGSIALQYTHESLQQLRNRTFGESQNSQNSSREGSPRSDRASIYPERAERMSPMPWDIHRPVSHLGMPHERNNEFWINPDTPGSPGHPPPPLSAPPPIPQSASAPALVEEAQAERTVKNTPEVSEGEPSPAGTFGQDAEERSLESFHAAVDSPGLLSPVERPQDRDSIAFGVNTEAIMAAGSEHLADIDATETAGSTLAYNVLLRGPVLTPDSLLSHETLDGAAR